VLYRAATRLELQAPRTWALGNTAINRMLWSPQGFTLVGWADTQHLDDDARDDTLVDAVDDNRVADEAARGAVNTNTR
jgi:2,3-bisphosphoglycerate-dependent phosphoglycerate mutase